RASSHRPSLSGGLQWVGTDPNQGHMSKTLPVIPMRSAVLFPRATLPVTAGRPATLKAIEAAMRDPEHRVFAVAQRDDSDEVSASNLYTTGTIATLSSVERGLGGVPLV